MCVPWCLWKSEDTLRTSLLSSMWVLGIELRSCAWQMLLSTKLSHQFPEWASPVVGYNIGF